jgi:hypothetical protein
VHADLDLSPVGEIRPENKEPAMSSKKSAVTKKKSSWFMSIVGAGATGILYPIIRQLFTKGYCKIFGKAKLNRNDYRIVNGQVISAVPVIISKAKKLFL